MMRLKLCIAFGAAAMLTGCASSGSVAAFKPGAASTTAARASASAPAPAVVGFPFPSNIHIEFQTPLPSDRQQAQAATAFENYQLAYYYAIYSGGKDSRYLSYLYSGDLQLTATAEDSVQQNEGESFKGTLRFYRMSVGPTPGEPGGLNVTACANQLKLFSTDRTTGKIVPGQDSSLAVNIALETYSLDHVNGSWKIVAIANTSYPNGAAKGCYP